MFSPLFIVFLALLFFPPLRLLAMRGREGCRLKPFPGRRSCNCGCSCARPALSSLSRSPSVQQRSVSPREGHAAAARFRGAASDFRRWRWSPFCPRHLILLCQRATRYPCAVAAGAVACTLCVVLCVSRLAPCFVLSSLPPPRSAFFHTFSPRPLLQLVSLRLTAPLPCGAVLYDFSFNPITKRRADNDAMIG